MLKKNFSKTCLHMIKGFIDYFHVYCLASYEVILPCTIYLIMSQEFIWATKRVTGDKFNLEMVTSDFKSQLPDFLRGNHPSILCMPTLKPSGLRGCLLFAWASCVVTFITWYQGQFWLTPFVTGDTCLCNCVLFLCKY